MLITIKQAGVGIVEIIVALLLLSIGVLGVVGLQVNAFDSTKEASERIMATALAQDLTERIRANPNAIAQYLSNLNAENQISSDTAAKSCYAINATLTATQMADCDTAQVIARAKKMGMQVTMPQCNGVSYTRSCIYVSWGETKPISSDTDVNACTRLDGIYIPTAKCIIFESY